MAPSLPPSVSAHQGLLPVVAESLEVLKNFKGAIICHAVAVDFQDALARTEPGSHSLGAWGTGALEARARFQLPLPTATPRAVPPPRGQPESYR